MWNGTFHFHRTSAEKVPDESSIWLRLFEDSPCRGAINLRDLSAQKLLIYLGGRQAVHLRMPLKGEKCQKSEVLKEAFL